MSNHSPETSCLRQSSLQMVQKIVRGSIMYVENTGHDSPNYFSMSSTFWGLVKLCRGVAAGVAGGQSGFKGTPRQPKVYNQIFLEKLHMYSLYVLFCRFILNLMTIDTWSSTQGNFYPKNF